MPRFDRFASLHPTLGTGEEALPEIDPASGEDPEIRSYRSGFWATVTVPARRAGRTVALTARARLEEGARRRLSSARSLSRSSDPRARPQPPRGASIAVCMSTYNPQIDLFRVQVESLRAQTDTDWICLISDDCSRPESVSRDRGRGRRATTASSSPARSGASASTGTSSGRSPWSRRRLRSSPSSDQDDRWYPDKLATLRAEIGEAELIYSDQRLVDRGRHGPRRAPTGRSRSNNHTNLTSLLIANTVTGAASMMQPRASSSRRCRSPRSRASSTTTTGSGWSR